MSGLVGWLFGWWVGELVGLAHWLLLGWLVGCSLVVWLVGGLGLLISCVECMRVYKSALAWFVVPRQCAVCCVVLFLGVIWCACVYTCI